MSRRNCKRCGVFTLHTYEEGDDPTWWKVADPICDACGGMELARKEAEPRAAKSPPPVKPQARRNRKTN